MAHDLTPAEQHELVREAIVEVAVRCDGAQSLDGQGFSGVDTKFGRRIAAVPYAQWTEDVKAEAAKIILKYRQQVLAWTEGRIDVGTLSVVKDAQDNGTNYQGRNDALNYSKRAKHLDARQIGVVRNARGQRVLGIRWANGDPDFSTFLGLVKALPGRFWNGATKTNEVPFSPQIAEFIDEWDFTVTEAGQAFIADSLTADTVAAPPINYEVTLGVDGKIYIKTGLTAPGMPACDAVKALPGRGFDRASYSNYANPHPKVLAFARQFGLNITPDAVTACEAAQAALEARVSTGLNEEDVNIILQDVSRCGRPQDLPPVFVTMFKEMMAR
jgi:hypothetical protein